METTAKKPQLEVKKASTTHTVEKTFKPDRKTFEKSDAEKKALKALKNAWKKGDHSLTD